MDIINTLTTSDIRAVKKYVDLYNDYWTAHGKTVVAQQRVNELHSEWEDNPHTDFQFRLGGAIQELWKCEKAEGIAKDKMEEAREEAMNYLLVGGYDPEEVDYILRNPRHSSLKRKMSELHTK